MKANEAPEKMYLIQDNGLVCYCRNNDDDIEYTKTDAFIDKVCEWLKCNLPYSSKPPYQVIEDLRKAMEE